jgi:hypothetical protein
MGRLPLITLLWLLVATTTAAQERDNERAPLRGIRELRVVVEQLHASSTAAGLNASQLQTDVERQLRDRGIPVARSEPSEAPYLYLRVTTRKGPGTGYPFSIELLVRDLVQLVRDPTITTRATIWTRNRGGYLDYADSNRDELARDVRDAIREMVNRFTDDYAAANSLR